MFNFGWGEIVLIGIVALIAIGPKELPTVLRSVGQMMAKVRRMAAEFQGQFQEALREAEIADLKKQAEDLHASVKSKVTDFTSLDPLADTKKDIEKAFDEPAGAPTASASEYKADAAPLTPVETLDALPPPEPHEALPAPAVHEALPPPAEPKVDLATIDVPLPEPLPPPTSADFLAKDQSKDQPTNGIETAQAGADKKAGGAA